MKRFISKRIIGDMDGARMILWWIVTVIAAFWVASQCASESPCRPSEEKAECHGRRIGEVNPFIILLILVVWIIVAIVLPRMIASRRATRHD